MIVVYRACLEMVLLSTSFDSVSRNFSEELSREKKLDESVKKMLLKLNFTLLVYLFFNLI